MNKYNPQKIERKWQRFWQAKKLHQTRDKEKGKKNFMLLTEFPYPSGNLHIGHWYAFAVPDILSRYLTMKGFNVMYPMGFDAFGLPAENAAIERKINPRDWTENNIKYMTNQLKSMGATFDWSRVVSTIDPDYYKWTQWIFLKMYEKGLVYRKKTFVNWCPKDKTVLANEQVINGCCERCSAEVIQKEIEQWMFKITDYADRLIDDLEGLDWPETTKLAQKNWIGRSEGAQINFFIKDENVKKIVLIHGKDANPESKEWYKWFKKLCDQKEIECIIPKLPKAEDPILNEWIAEIEKTNPDEKTILIGHSRGGVAILRWMERLAEGKNIRKVVLVAANSGDGNGEKSDFFDAGKFNYQKIKKHSQKFVVFHSKDDEWVPFSAGVENAKGLDAKFYQFENRGHFGRKVMNIPELKEELFPQIEVFTTRVDTIYGCTYVVVAPENEIISNLKSQISNLKEVENYISEAKKKSNLQRMEVAKNKTGVELKGIKAVNPFTNKEVSIFVADYVLGSYGTGAVMAVPAHDERDFEFAKKYNLSIKKVISPNYGSPTSIVLNKAFTEDGILINSGNYTGMVSGKAREEMAKWLKENNLGGPKKTYKLHDWVLSRQRYWGVPIPVIKCAKCASVGSAQAGYVPVPEKDLPVKLPKLDNFLPSSDGRSPLARAKTWVKVKCPKCKGVAERETDTMDTFVDSSWYFIRYADPKNKNKFADSKKMKNWLPVPLYIGGAEHNTMHLLYSRFFTKVLYDLKFIHFNEPFVGRINHGVILGPDNQKMSKSRGNVIDPDKEVEKFGADSMKMYLAFMGPYGQGGPWQLNGIIGIYRFLNRVYNFCSTDFKNNSDKSNKELERLLHQTIKKVGDDIANLRFNTAISSLMILFNAIEKNPTQLSYRTEPSGCRPNDSITQFLILLSPFAPHLTEEIWQQLKTRINADQNADKRRYISSNQRKSTFRSIHFESWPKYDEKIIAEEKIDLIIQVNGKLRDIIKVERGINQKSTKILALSSEKVKNAIGGKKVKKVIFVQDKLINFVV